MSHHTEITETEPPREPATAVIRFHSSPGRSAVKTALICTLLAIGASFGACDLAYAENAMYSCFDANGIEQLTNVPTNNDCMQLFSYAPPPAPATTQTVGAAASESATSAVAAVARTDSTSDTATAAPSAKSTSKPLLAQHRDDIVQRTRDAYEMGVPAALGNRATSRRYLMTNRAAYQAANGVILP